MERIIFKSVILFFIFSLSIAPCFAKNQDKAQAKNEQKELYIWDFGKVKQGQVLRHDFSFKNESRKSLKIKNVNTSCGCTVSNFEKDILFPGESTNISVEFSSEGYSGEVQQYIYVHTDNLDNPIVRLIIKADVVNGAPQL